MPGETLLLSHLGLSAEGQGAPLIKIGLVDESDGRYDDYPGQRKPVLH